MNMSDGRKSEPWVSISWEFFWKG